MTFRLRSQLLVCLLATTVMGQGIFKSKNVVTKIPPANGKLVKLDGVPYALPRTVLQVQIPVKRIDKTPGEFARYARCFLSKEVAEGRIIKKSKSFSIEQPTFTSRGEPDPSEHYIAKIKGGFFENKTMLLEFNGDGIITKGDASSENTAIDVAVKAARTAISVAATAVRGPSAATSSGSLSNSADAKRVRETPEVNICRSLIIAEVAAMAADRADEAAKVSEEAAKVLNEVAKASGDPKALKVATEAQEAAKRARDAAATARQNADLSELAIEAARRTLAKKQEDNLIKLTEDERLLSSAQTALSSAGDKDAASKKVEESRQRVLNTVNAAIDSLNELTFRLLKQVIDLAVKTGQSVEIAAENAAKLASDEAEAARKAAANINEARNFIGVEDNGLRILAFENGYIKAREKFERLTDLKRKREDLASGESAITNLASDTLKMLLDQSDAVINTYLNTFFLGTKSDDSWTGNFKFIPGKAVVSDGYNTSQTSPVMFLFSKADGLCETDETIEQGVKVKDNFKAEKCPRDPDKSEAVWLRVERQLSDDDFLGHMAAANARDESKGERGFYYRIPATALIRLEKGNLTKAQIDGLAKQSKDGQKWRLRVQNTPPPNTPTFMPSGKEIGRNTMKVAQLGVTASLPASAAGRKTQYTIDFDEATGAMKNFKLASNALLEKSIVDEAGGAANDILGAKQSRDTKEDAAAKAQTEANDPLTQKKRELDLLKTENQINEEKKKLAESQQPPPL